MNTTDFTHNNKRYVRYPNGNVYIDRDGTGIYCPPNALPDEVAAHFGIERPLGFMRLGPSQAAAFTDRPPAIPGSQIFEYKGWWYAYKTVGRSWWEWDEHSGWILMKEDSVHPDLKAMLLAQPAPAQTPAESIGTSFFTPPPGAIDAAAAFRETDPLVAAAQAELTRKEAERKLNPRAGAKLPDAPRSTAAVTDQAGNTRELDIGGPWGESTRPNKPLTLADFSIRELVAELSRRLG
jgi:hypothetical protein